MSEARRGEKTGSRVDYPFDGSGRDTNHESMPFMYILECSDKTFYVGSTWDLLVRLKQHKDGEGGQYTKRRLPLRLVYYEYYEHITEAWGRERKVHGWTHGKKRILVRDGPGVRVADDSKPFA